MKIRNKFISVIQIMVAIAIFPLYFYLVPWLNVKPIDELKLEYKEKIEIPNNAKTYYINHGEVVYRNHGTIKQEPIKFWLSVLSCVILLTLLILGQYLKNQNAKQEHT